MIVLSRKSIDIGTASGRIYVGGDIVIHLSEIGRGKVRIGISAPKDVPIFRGELLTYADRLKIEIAAGFSAAEKHHHELGGEG